MNNKKLKYSYFAGVLLSIIGALMKIQHVNFSELFLSLGILASLLFIILAIMEVNRSRKISDSEKFRWSIGFIFFGGLIGLVYVFSARKRIV